MKNIGIIYGFLLIVLFSVRLSASPTEEWFSFSTLELTIQCPTILRAKPIFDKNSWPERYIITEVFKDAGNLQIEDTVRVYYGLTYSWGTSCDLVRGPFTGEQAILFGSFDRVKHVFSLFTSGIRVVYHDSVYRPIQLVNPGPYCMIPSPLQDWPRFYIKIRHDIERINSLLAIKAIAAPAERNIAIFNWLDSHMAEFHGSSTSSDEIYGWGSLESQVFSWATALTPEQQDLWNMLHEMYENTKYPDFNRTPLENTAYISLFNGNVKLNDSIEIEFIYLRGDLLPLSLPSFSLEKEPSDGSKPLPGTFPIWYTQPYSLLDGPLRIKIPTAGCYPGLYSLTILGSAGPHGRRHWKTNNVLVTIY